MSSDIKELILSANENYNKYHSPESIAKLIKVKKNSFIVDFEGSYCFTCGVSDYFEDLIYELKDINNRLNVEIVKIDQLGVQRYRVYYSFNEGFEKIKLEEESLFKKFLEKNGISLEKYFHANSCSKDVILFHFRSWKSGENE